MIDWTTIIAAVIALLSVEGILKAVDKIRHKKQDTQLKNNEVEKDNTDTDHKQIDLGDLFLEKTVKWGEMLEANTVKLVNMTRKIDEENVKRDEDWKNLKEDMEYVKSEVGSISEYLNGDYQNFKNNGGKRGKRK